MEADAMEVSSIEEGIPGHDDIEDFEEKCPRGVDAAAEASRSPSLENVNLTNDLAQAQDGNEELPRAQYSQNVNTAIQSSAVKLPLIQERSSFEEPPGRRPLRAPSVQPPGSHKFSVSIAELQEPENQSSASFFRTDRSGSDGRLRDLAIDVRLLAQTLAEMLRDQLRSVVREEFERSEVLECMREDMHRYLKRFSDIEVASHARLPPAASASQTRTVTGDMEPAHARAEELIQHYLQNLRPKVPSEEVGTRQALHTHGNENQPGMHGMSQRFAGVMPRHPAGNEHSSRGAGVDGDGLTTEIKAMQAQAAARPHQTSFSSNYSAPAFASQVSASASQISEPRKVRLIGAEGTSNSAWMQKSWGGAPNLSDLEECLDGDLFASNDLLDGEDKPKPPSGSYPLSMGSLTKRTWGMLRRGNSNNYGNNNNTNNNSNNNSDSSNTASAAASEQEPGLSSAASPSSPSFRASTFPPLQSSVHVLTESDAASSYQVESDSHPSFIAEHQGPIGSVTSDFGPDAGELMLGHGESEGTKDAAARQWFRVPTCQRLMSLQQEKELAASLELDAGPWGATDVVTRLKSERPSRFKVARMRIMCFLASKATPSIGLLPWSQRYIWTSTLYQWIVLASLSCCLAYSCKQMADHYAQGLSTASVLTLDAILTAGATGGLLGFDVYWRSISLAKCVRLMRAYSIKVGAKCHWEEVSQMDFACAVGLWLVAVLWRAKDCFHDLQPPTLSMACFAYSTAVLIGLSSYIIHICRCLVKMADTFFFHFADQPDFADLLQKWSLLHSLVRSACKSIQIGFAALQITVTATVCLSITHIAHFEWPRFLSIVPSLVVSLGVIRTCIWAAAVTDKCTRIPMLINSISIGNVLDADRMYCVQHIAHCQAGFYLFEIRLTSSAIFKVVYIASAMAFGMTTQVLV